MINNYNLQLAVVLEELQDLVNRYSNLSYNLAHPFLNKDSKFVLTDLSPNMLTLTKAKLYGSFKRISRAYFSDLHDPTPIIEPANLQDLKYADGSFDRVYGNYVIHLVPDPGIHDTFQFKIQPFRSCPSTSL